MYSLKLLQVAVVFGMEKNHTLPSPRNGHSLRTSVRHATGFLSRVMMICSPGASESNLRQPGLNVFYGRGLHGVTPHQHDT